MSVFKVVARDPKTGKQWKKKIYVGEAYNKYATNLVVRWQEYHDIEVYEMYHEEWRLWYKLHKPKTEEEVKQFQLDKNYSDIWYNHYIKNHL